jgi:hypothetical protein
MLYVPRDPAVLYGFGINVALRTGVSETAASYARCQRDFREENSNLTPASSYFHSVGIQHTDLVPCPIITLFDIIYLRIYG